MEKLNNETSINKGHLYERYNGGGYRLTKAQAFQGKVKQVKAECVECSEPHTTDFDVVKVGNIVTIGCTKFYATDVAKVLKWAKS